MEKLTKQLVPFLLLGIAIVAFSFGILLLAYLFLFGALLGLILFTVNWLRNKFFPSKKNSHKKKHDGRVIDSNDWHKL
jgi:hypothetical protein